MVKANHSVELCGYTDPACYIIMLQVKAHDVHAPLWRSFCRKDLYDMPHGVLIIILLAYTMNAEGACLADWQSTHAVCMEPFVAAQHDVSAPLSSLLSIESPLSALGDKKGRTLLPQPIDKALNLGHIGLSWCPQCYRLPHLIHTSCVEAPLIRKISSFPTLTAWLDRLDSAYIYHLCKEICVN